jgi:3-oxoacyl-[acyl-carrier protein] reductase
MTGIDLSGRNALVTGGTRGIGAGIAQVLSRCGARVAITGRDAAVASDAAARISDSAVGVACDVSDSDAVNNMIAAVEAALGGIDILVNNAGLTRDNILVRMKDEDWDAVIDTNLRGAFATIRAASRGMMKRRWGRIINISSVVGIMGNRGQANYAASKAGLIGLTRAVAREYASRNILVNAIAPGYIETDMTAAMSEAARTSLIQQIPLERLGNTADVANAVAFLASDLASYITGQVLVVDGGMVM